MVDSDAAAALGDLVRERWRRATGKRLRVADGRPGDPWPPGVTPDLQHVPVAISRTEPAYDVRQEVREVESLYLDSIRHARRFIYLENQYLSSSAIGDALAVRLQEKRWPGNHHGVTPRDRRMARTSEHGGVAGRACSSGCGPPTALADCMSIIPF